jgi:hypothetical protein
MLLQALSVAVSLGILVCYVMVVVQMFRHGKTGPGLMSTLGLLLCGLGGLFAFVYGWMKAAEWRMTNVMIAWTVLIVVNIGMSAAVLPAALENARREALRQQNAAPAPAAR